MAKDKSNRKAKTQGDLYYDENKMFLRAAQGVVTRTTFPITEEGILVPFREDHNLQPLGTITWYLNGPQGSQFSTRLTFEGQGGHDHSAGTNDTRASQIDKSTLV